MVDDVAKWMKLNLLAVIGMLVSFVGFAVGGIWSASAWNSDLRHDNADLKRVNTAQDVRLDETHTALVDVDRRLNEITTRQNEARHDAETTLANARRETDANLAKAGADVAVLQAQMKFLADRTPPAAPLPGGVR